MVKRETLVTSEQGAAVVVGAAPGRPPEQALRQSGASGAGLGAGSEYPLSSMAPVVAGAPGVETTQALTPSQAAEMPVYARDGVAQAGDAEPADSLLFAASADEAAVPGGISGPNSPGEGGRGRGGGDGRAGGGTSGEQPADGDDGDEERNVHAAGLFEVRGPQHSEDKEPSRTGTESDAKVDERLATVTEDDIRTFGDRTGQNESAERVIDFVFGTPKNKDNVLLTVKQRTNAITWRQANLDVQQVERAEESVVEGEAVERPFIVSFESLARAVHEDVVQIFNDASVIDEPAVICLGAFVENREMLITLHEDVKISRNDLAEAEEIRRQEDNSANFPSLIGVVLEEKISLHYAQQAFRIAEGSLEEPTREARREEHVDLFLHGIYEDDPLLDELSPAAKRTLALQLIQHFADGNPEPDKEMHKNHAIMYLEGEPLANISKSLGESESDPYGTANHIGKVAEGLHKEFGEGKEGEAGQVLDTMLRETVSHQTQEEGSQVLAMTMLGEKATAQTPVEAASVPEGGEVVITLAEFNSMLARAQSTTNDRTSMLMFALVRSMVHKSYGDGSGTSVSIDAALYEALNSLGAQESGATVYELPRVKEGLQDLYGEDEAGDVEVSVGISHINKLLDEGRPNAAKRRVAGDVFLDLIKQQYLSAPESTSEMPDVVIIDKKQLRELEKLAGPPPEEFINLLERLGSTGLDELTANEKSFVDTVFSRMVDRRTELLKLRYGEGLGLQDLCERWGGPVSEVGSLLTRAKYGFIDASYEVLKGTSTEEGRRHDTSDEKRVAREQIQALVAKAESQVRDRDVAGDVFFDLLSQQLESQVDQSQDSRVIRVPQKQFKELEAFAAPDYLSWLDKFRKGTLRPDLEILVERSLLFLAEGHREMLELHYGIHRDKPLNIYLIQRKLPGNRSMNSVSSSLSKAKKSFGEVADVYANGELDLGEWRKNFIRPQNVLCLLDAFDMDIPSDARLDVLNSSAKKELKRRVAALDIGEVAHVLNLKEISADKIRDVVEDLYGLKDGKHRQLKDIGAKNRLTTLQVRMIVAFVVDR